MIDIRLKINVVMFTQGCLKNVEGGVSVFTSLRDWNRFYRFECEGMEYKCCLLSIYICREQNIITKMLVFIWLRIWACHSVWNWASMLYTLQSRPRILVVCRRSKWSLLRSGSDMFLITNLHNWLTNILKTRVYKPVCVCTTLTYGRPKYYSIIHQTEVGGAPGEKGH